MTENVTDEKKCGDCCGGQNNGQNTCHKNSKLHFEPLFWSLFGNGGTIAALCFPVIVLIFGILLPMGVFSGDHLYDNMSSFVHNFLGKLIILFILVFNMWHACHRIYHALHDFKLHPPCFVKTIIYGFAGLVSLAILVLII